MPFSPTTPWPPAAPLCSPTVPRQDAVFQACGSCRIDAPAELVFDNLLLISNYGEWNTFVPEARLVSTPPDRCSHEQAGHIKQDSIMRFFVVMNSAKPNSTTQTELQVTDISTPDSPSDYLDADTLQHPAYTSDLSKVYRISWKSHGAFVTKGLRSERFHEIIILGQSQCELRTWEVFGGVLAHAVKWMYQKTLNDKFQLWADDLKKYSEQQHAAQSKNA